MDRTEVSATVAIERPRARVALLTLNRPDRMNAMTGEMFADLEQAAAELGADRSIRAIILTGAGRGFCPGFDLADAPGLRELGVAGMLRFQERAAAAVLALHHMPQPVIAAVNGAAAGGGFSLALAADIRIAASTAKFAAMFVRGGFSAGDLGCSWFLPRLVGLGRAVEMTCTGRIVDPQEALAVGLVSEIVAPEDLLDRALAIAEQIAANSPIGVRMTLRAIYANVDAPSLRTAVELENRGQAMLSPGPDVAEVLTARAEGRTPAFAD
jgi:enoyl-CoA hydratase/carnithine racemase